MKLECIKGYAHEEGIVCLQGDIVVFNGTDDGIVELEGIQGWCEGLELAFSPEMIVNHFKVKFD
jgi:surfactin synthase thioesterase subunit